MEEKNRLSAKRKNNFILNSDDYRVLFLLYKMLFGSDTLNLYFTLYFLSVNQKDNDFSTLFLKDSMSEEDISDEKIKGFVKTLNLYRLLKEDAKSGYTLYPPYEGKEFFKTPLSICLKEYVAPSHYSYLLDVFGSTDLKSDVFFHSPEETLKGFSFNIREKKNTPFNFSEFKEAANKNGYQIIDLDADFFISLANLFSLSLSDCLTILFETSNNNSYDKNMVLEKVLERNKILEEKKARKENKNIEDEKYIDYFKANTPESILKAGTENKVASADLKTIDRLRDEQSLPDELISVLISYSLVTAEGKMKSYNFFEKIALDWQKKNIKTAEDAYFYISSLYNNKKIIKENEKTQTSEEWFKDYWDKIIKEEKR
ncbi:MAG: DnaD domain protein [Bacillales bacterium]|nr:DnaD domain protein [Bacillales bacterium]